MKLTETMNKTKGKLTDAMSNPEIQKKQIYLVVPRDIKLGNKKLIREKYIIDNSEQFPKQNPTSNFKTLYMD
jgi:hypothetical protein